MAYLIVLALAGAATAFSGFALPLVLLSAVASWDDPETTDRRVLAAITIMFVLSFAATLYLATHL